MRSWLRTLVVYFAASVCLAAGANAQTPVSIRVVDENGIAISEALVSVRQGQGPVLSLRTDYLGRCRFFPSSNAPYSIRVEKPGFYVLNSSDVNLSDDAPFVLVHQQ